MRRLRSSKGLPIRDALIPIGKNEELEAKTHLFLAPTATSTRLPGRSGSAEKLLWSISSLMRSPAMIVLPAASSAKRYRRQVG